MSAKVIRFEGSKVGSAAARTAALWLAAGAIAVALPACSDDKAAGGASALQDGGGGSGGGGGGSDFETCVANLTPVCKTRELDTGEKIGSAECGGTEFIPIPLTDGTSYGPVTIEAGPYGGKVDWNQGAGTEFVNPINDSESSCLTSTIDAFGEPTAVTDDLKNMRSIDFSLYTIFRPACMKDGEKYPVITWANGTCGFTHGYAMLLGGVSSHGFVVIAPNSTWTNTAPTNTVQTRAIDYAEAINEDPSSPLYHRLDLDKIGAMGHSQGAMATTNAAKDPRVKSVIFWNQGTTNEKPFLNVSGDRDIGNGPVSGLKSATEAATQPGAWLYYHQVLVTGGNFTGHLVLMEQPDRVWETTVNWWKWQLNGDTEAKKAFVGDGCGLCGKDAEFEYGHNAAMQ